MLLSIGFAPGDGLLMVPDSAFSALELLLPLLERGFTLEKYCFSLLKCGLVGVCSSLLCSGHVQGTLGLENHAIPDLLGLRVGCSNLLEGGFVLFLGPLGAVLEVLPDLPQFPSAFGLGGLLGRQISAQLLDGMVHNLEEVTRK